MADPTKAIKGGLSAIRNASRAADQALEAKRLALEAANPPIKASEAYGQHEGAYMKPIFYDRMRVDLSKDKKGGPGFSGIQLVDPNYADAKAAAGVTDQKMATRILNRNKAGVPAGAKVIWTPSVGGLEQHKSNSTMFGEFADIFANQRKNMSNEEIQKLSDRASNAVDNKGKLIFPNGIDLGSRNFRQQVKTYDQRGLMADIFAGRGVGGEKGRTVPVEELLEKNIDPNVANAGTLDLGNRLFRLEGDVIDRPDLHSDYRKILTGEDLGVNYIPVPIRDVYTDWEAQKALDLAAQGKNRGVTLMDYTKNDPTVQLTEELLTKMQKAGKKAGGAVNRTESPADMARFHKRFAMHKAIGGKVKKMAGGGRVSIFDAPAKRMASGGRASIFDTPVKRMAEGGESIDKSLKRMQGYSVLDQKDPSKMLSGNIMAGASWNSINPTLADRLTEATGKPTYNAAVGATTSADTYKQLMDFIEAGGSFEQGSNVFLQAGGADFLKGVPRKETQENLDKILTELENQGVNVVLTGSPNASSYEQVISNNFDPASDPIYNDVVSKHSNVVLVDSMGEILQDKSLLSDSIHPNEQGWEVYNDSVLGALNQLNQRNEAVKNTNTVDKVETVVENQDTPVEIPAVTDEALNDSDVIPTDKAENDNDVAEAIAELDNQEQEAAVTDSYGNMDDYQPPQQVSSVPDYSRAYEALGGADVVSGLRDQFLGMGIEENTIADIFSNYYSNESQPSGAGRFGESYATEQYKRGGAVGQESPADMARFKKRFAMHKAIGGSVKKMASGGRASIFDAPAKRFDGGGIASPEESSGPPPDREQTKAGLMAEFLAKMAKDQGKEELSSLKKPRALTDLLNRGVLANNPLSAGVDLFNLGLGAVGMGSEKPFLGSEHMKDLMNKTGVTSGEERPMMETALSFASPTAMIKGGMKATEAAKKAPELLNKASSAITSSKLSPLATEAKTASAGKPTGATYATKQEGPFFRVSPTTLDTSKAKNRGIREADELQGQAPLGGGAGSFGSQVPTRLADEEVARIIADPVANEPLNIAKKYTQETQGTDFVLPEMPESSLVKQSAIGRTHQLAVEGSPEYKTAVFDAYAQQMPDVLEQAGAKNYDDLMEKAYRQLAKETDAQFQALPYNFSYHRAGEGNYNSSKEMSADVHGNKHLYVFQGGDPHDFLNRVDPASGLNENEKFRAVHDLLGHAIYGNQFGPKGEETAWAIHSQMYSPLARLAMTAETRGQNSMVNYSPLNANLKAEIAKYDSLAEEARRRGDKGLMNEINAAKRQAYSGFQFAPQKAVLLPPEFLSTQYAGGMPDYLQAANRPAKGTETQSVLTHFSNQPDLQMLDPKKYGSGIKGAEGERLRDYAGGVKDRSYFYLGEPGTVSPEPGLGANRYRGEASSLYDITQDPLNFQRLARESNRVPYTAKYNQGMTYPLQDANDVERLIKEYGYEGMANPKATKPMAIMFKETPVRRQARGGLTLMK